MHRKIWPRKGEQDFFLFSFPLVSFSHHAYFHKKLPGKNAMPAFLQIAMSRLYNDNNIIIFVIMIALLKYHKEKDQVHSHDSVFDIFS